jgi:hypothetical protein
MNRIRHAYLEIAPDLEQYFVSSPYDDMAGILSAYSTGREERGGWVSGILHGMTTTPGMIAVINAVIAGGLASTIAIGVGLGGFVPVAVGIVSAIVAFLLIGAVFARDVMSMDQVPARFPSPPRPDGNPRIRPFT